MIAAQQLSAGQYTMCASPRFARCLRRLNTELIEARRHGVIVGVRFAQQKSHPKCCAISTSVAGIVCTRVVFPEVPLRSHMEQVPLYLLIFNNMLKIKIIPTTLRSGQWVTFADFVIGNNLLPTSI